MTCNCTGACHRPPYRCGGGPWPDDAPTLFDARIDAVCAASRYPNRAGFKEKGGTSQEAAATIEAKGRAQNLRDLVRGAFELGWQGTADELAERLGHSILSIRPRVTELHKQGLLVRTGTRHRNESGASAHVWKLNPVATRRAG